MPMVRTVLSIYKCMIPEYRYFIQIQTCHTNNKFGQSFKLGKPKYFKIVIVTHTHTYRYLLD